MVRIIIIGMLALGIGLTSQPQMGQAAANGQLAKMQVADQDQPPRSWHTEDPREKRDTVLGLTGLIFAGGVASWARRRFY